MAVSALRGVRPVAVLAATLFASQFLAAVGRRTAGLLGIRGAVSLDDGMVVEGNVEGERFNLGNDSAIFRFDSRLFRNLPNSSMTVTRQGELRYSGKQLTLDFPASELHREFLVDVGRGENQERVCEQPVFVKTEAMPGICSTGLFTAPSLTCSAFPANRAREEIQSLSGLMPPAERGLGLEFEFVARELSDEQVFRLLKYLSDQYGEIVRKDGDKRYSEIMGVKQCFEEATSGEQAKPCGTSADCALSEYCVDCARAAASCEAFGRSNATGICFPRIECDEGTPSMEGGCPVAHERWHWERDGSVRPLSDEEAAAIGADEGEKKGVAFEVVSPGPPHVLSGATGLKSTFELLAVLRHMGIQSGPSQGFHVHVNVLGDAAPGVHLTHREVVHVWAAYAKYQLVVDEMLSPGRPGNRYAARLYLGDCRPHAVKGRCANNPCGCNRRIFQQMHKWLSDKGTPTRTTRDFCNFVIAMPGLPNPCEKKYPHVRYTQLNLVPLNKYGTIEFRAHSATYDPQRVGRWVQFLVAFVEYFGKGAGREEMAVYFSGKEEEDYAKLRHAQEQAKAAQLFKALGTTIDRESASFFMERVWERGDATCVPPEGEVKEAAVTCEPEDSGFVKARLKSQAGTRMLLYVRLAPSYPNQITVVLPDGAIWSVTIKRIWTGEPFRAVLPNGRVASIEETRRGFYFEFAYDPEAERRRAVEEAITQHHRCCCEGFFWNPTNCLWFPQDRLRRWNGLHCPRLWEPLSGVGERCASSRLCMFNARCTQTHHRPGRCMITRNASAYFHGPRLSSPDCENQTAAPNIERETEVFGFDS